MAISNKYTICKSECILRMFVLPGPYKYDVKTNEVKGSVVDFGWKDNLSVGDLVLSGRRVVLSSTSQLYVNDQ